MLDIATEPWGIKVCFEFVFGESIFFVFFYGGIKVCFEFVFGESIYFVFFMGESRSVLNLCLVDRDRDKGGYKYEDK